jgi:alcohol dehydrogenase class IV
MNKQVFEFPLSYSDVLPRIVTGWGAYETLADECRAVNINKALIVTTGLKGTGVIDEIKASLNYHGIAVDVFDQVTSNPRDYQVMAAHQAITSSQCDGLVSVGGGSSHDCAKMARVVAANDGRDITEFAAYIDPPWMEQVKKFKPCVLPQVAVTTTAGTGAEVTSLATLTNTKLRAKQLVIAPRIGAVTAIVDPLLVRLIPAKFAAWTGFDALAHAFETYISRVQSPYTSGLSLRAMQYISKNLREFTYNRMNHDACQKMAWASTTAGICMALGSGAGMVHGLGHQISALTDSHHGLSNAVMSLPVEEYNQSSCPEKFADMARAMGVDTRGMTTVEAADMWFDEIERLLDDLEIETGNLGEQFGIKAEDFDHMVKIYANDFSREGNPRNFDYDETVELLESVL